MSKIKIGKGQFQAMPFLPLLTQKFGAMDVNAPFQSVLLSFQDVTLHRLGSFKAF